MMVVVAATAVGMLAIFFPPCGNFFLCQLDERVAEAVTLSLSLSLW